MNVLRILALRIAQTLPVLLVVSLIVFFLLHLTPGDPAVRAAGGQNATIEQVEATRIELGLDRPIHEQYLDWTSGVIQGDLGRSLFGSRTVASELARGLPVTLSLVLGAMLLAVGAAVPLGIYAAAHPQGRVDRLVSVLATLGIATPNFAIALVAIGTFALWLGWLPGGGYVRPDVSITEWAQRLLLPSIALGFNVFAELVRHIRASVRSVLTAPYIRTARAKGMPEWLVTLKHATKPGALPIITVLGLQLRRLFGGTIVIEFVFGMPGMSSIALKAVFDRDYPVIQGYAVLTVLVVLLVNLAVDLTYSYLNPRVSRT